MSLSTAKPVSARPGCGKRPSAIAVLVSLAAALWLGAPLAACATSKSNSAANSASITAKVEPILWQIDPAAAGANESKLGRLYLLGSIHVGPRGGWQLPAATLARFESADALVVEVDLRGGSQEEQDDAVLHYGLLPGGESIKNHISPALYNMLERRIAALGRSIANINPWKPWMVANKLLTFEIERLGYPAEAGLDLDLMARVTKKQRVIGLETAAEQLSLLGGMSPANQELMLRDILLQADDIESYFNELKEAWRTGNENKLEEVLFRELEATPELAPFYEKVIYDRNRTMCDRLQKLLEGGDETLFGVVGAYHLVGTRGIPACLASRGYRVTSLRDRAGISDRATATH